MIHTMCNKANTHLIRSSCQSISLPMIEKRALESMSTRTPSCCTISSNFPGSSTYSRWYCIPAQPLLRTPTRTSWGVGPDISERIRCTADGVYFVKIAGVKGCSQRYGGRKEKFLLTSVRAALEERIRGAIRDDLFEGRWDPPDSTGGEVYEEDGGTTVGGCSGSEGEDEEAWKVAAVRE
jgi:hypothetical protein